MWHEELNSDINITMSIQHCTRSHQCNKSRKIKVYELGKEQAVIICVYRGFKESTDKLLKLILKFSNFSKVIEYKGNIQKFIAFLYVLKYEKTITAVSDTLNT